MNIKPEQLKALAERNMVNPINFNKISKEQITLTYNNADLGCFLLDVDGEYKYWPPKEGCSSSWMLHRIAVALDNANDTESLYISNESHKALVKAQQSSHDWECERLNKRITKFDSVIRDICTTLKLTYAGVDIDEGEIVEAIKAWNTRAAIAMEDKR